MELAVVLVFAVDHSFCLDVINYDKLLFKKDLSLHRDQPLVMINY